MGKKHRGLIAVCNVTKKKTGGKPFNGEKPTDGLKKSAAGRLKYRVVNFLPNEIEEFFYNNLESVVTSQGYDYRSLDKKDIDEAFNKVRVLTKIQRLQNRRLPFLDFNHMLLFISYYTVTYAVHKRDLRLKEEAGTPIKYGETSYLHYLANHPLDYFGILASSVVEGRNITVDKEIEEKYVGVYTRKERVYWNEPTTIQELSNTFKQWFLLCEQADFSFKKVPTNFFIDKRFKNMFTSVSFNDGYKGVHKVEYLRNSRIIYNKFSLDGDLTGEYYCSGCASKGYYNKRFYYRQETVEYVIAKRIKRNHKLTELACSCCKKDLLALTVPVASKEIVRNKNKQYNKLMQNVTKGKGNNKGVALNWIKK